jgi:hypothetical protein
MRKVIEMKNTVFILPFSVVEFDGVLLDGDALWDDFVVNIDGLVEFYPTVRIGDCDVADAFEGDGSEFQKLLFAWLDGVFLVDDGDALWPETV